MKKIIKGILSLMLVAIVFISNGMKVNATATSGDIVGGKYVAGTYYAMHSKGTHNMWFQAQFLQRSKDGAFVYCVQPFVTVKEDNTYQVTTEDIAAVLNISQATWSEISKIAYYGYQYTDTIKYELTINNHLSKGTLEFTKSDFSTSETLPNTLIEIYTENDELIFSGRTDEEGKIVIQELPIGKYYILEKEAPEGYTLNDEKMNFEIKEDGEIIKCNMLDEKIVVDVPNTNAVNYGVPISIVLLVGSAGVIVYEIIKDKKRK